MIDIKIINLLPSTFGVYLFKSDKTVIYVGKSVNIKARIKSHIENSHFDRKENLIINNSNKIETITTDCEFNALLLEAELIKKYQPKYNIIAKDNKSNLYIKITTHEKYPKIFLVRKENDGRSSYFGPFSSVAVINELIDDIRHIIPFCTQKNTSNRPCFYSHINLCNPCPNKIITLINSGDKSSATKIYRSNIKKIVAILSGKVNPIIKNHYRLLKQYSREKQFEKAMELRNKIFRLERLTHFSLTKNNNYSVDTYLALNQLIDILKPYYPLLSKINRIEGYDISNLGSKQAVGSMVVATAGKIDKSQYRKFKIKVAANASDLFRLKEVIGRRLNQNWPKPNLIVIDGGRPQAEIINKTLHGLNIKIPLVSIAKNPDRLIMGINGYPTVVPTANNAGFNLVRRIRDESHRFARKFHLNLRGKDFLV